MRVFVSYSHQDSAYLERDSLLGFLSGLEHQGVRLWTDREILAGADWDETIRHELDRSDLAIALVSQAFLDSRYCQDIEILTSLVRSITVLPLILSPCDWQRHDWLARTQFLPRDGKTVEEHFRDDGSRKRLFSDFRAALVEHVERIRDEPPPVEPGARLPPRPEIFVGREDTVEELVELTRERRLVTLLGPGGTGKTALALEVAHEHARARTFEDGIAWVELDSIEDPSLVPGKVAAAVGIKEQAERPPTEYLADHLRSSETLVVLDNCEHLVEACREVVQELLGHCPGVHLLATSRAGLRLGRQQIYPVRPLAVPDIRQRSTPRQLLGFAGIDLFVQTYRLTDPDFSLSSENADAVARIVARLDGIPLAIRLVASGCALSVTLTIQRVSEKLDDMLPVLRRLGDLPDRDLLDRPHHQTLETTIEWSFSLLGAAARALFPKLSVFVGGFSWEDIAAVCYPEGETPSEAALVELVRHSLVVSIPDPTGETKRFRLLEFVRQDGRRRLEAAGERDRWITRHCAHYLRVAEAAAERLLGSEQSTTAERLEREYSNLRVALARTVGEFEDPDTALRLAAALWRFWEIRGYIKEARERIAQVLAIASGRSAAHLTLYEGASTLAYRQGDFSEAERFIRRALEIAEELDQPARVANALNDLGNIASQRGDYESALELMQKSFHLKTEHEPPGSRQLAVAHNNLGGTFLHLGRFAEAREHLETSRSFFESLDNTWESGFPLARLGTLALFQKRFDEAEQFFRTSYERRVPTDDKRGMGEAMNGLARAAVWRGDLEVARQRLRTAISLRREVGDMRGLAETLECLVFYLRAHARFTRGVEVLGAVETIRGDGGSVAKPLFQPYLEAFRKAARDHLGDSGFDEAWKRGEALSRLETLTLAGHLLAEPEEERERT